MTEIKLTGGGRSEVYRKGEVVLRKSDPWTQSVHEFLNYLESKDFQGSPRVIGEGFDDKGREVLSYIGGDFVHPKPFSDEAIIAIGKLLKELHDLSKDFINSPEYIWRPWFGRDLDFSSRKVIGHCDFAPWNLVSNKGVPFAAIDWENAGPVDPLVELAHVCWVNVQLCDDDVAERVGLGSVEDRAKQLKLLVDTYGLAKEERNILLDIIIKVATLDAADQAIEADVKFDTKDVESLWGLAWRTRSAAWMIKNYQILNKALTN